MSLFLLPCCNLLQVPFVLAGNSHFDKVCYKRKVPDKLYLLSQFMNIYNPFRLLSIHFYRPFSFKRTLWSIERREDSASWKGGRI
ncbi:hypothetical protein Sjap_003121 [Stephania japonica]|uniref:Secreted protein n=1 Tax=Stephania japonica TaxID=461633 RepID=A0AAP0KNB4_9MAGN